MRRHLVWLLVSLTLPLAAAEREFDFNLMDLGQPPAGFRSTVTGQGKPGDWKVLVDEAPPGLAPANPNARGDIRQAVVGQLAKDPTDDHYPLLVYEGETFGDFKLTTRFKIVSGVTEQMAGVAFRIQDEKNYCYVRASALGNSFYFFKFVKGELIGPFGPKVEITKGVWHELSVECAGSLVTCCLDGKPLIPGLRQDDFPKGKIGFWTKSDSVSYFTGTKIVYRPLVDPAQNLALEFGQKYSRLAALRLYVLGEDRQTTRLVGSKDPTEVGQHGGKTELAVITQGVIYYGTEKTNNTVAVTLPLRDRNGDIIAALRVVMKSFKGQTEENAIARATPILRDVQNRVLSLQDLVQ